MTRLQFKHSNKHALSCLLWHRLKHTNFKCTALSGWALTWHSIQSSKLSYAASAGCETRSLAISLKAQQVTETQRYKFSYRQIMQSCLAPPLLGVRCGSLPTFQSTIE